MKRPRRAFGSALLMALLLASTLPVQAIAARGPAPALSPSRSGDIRRAIDERRLLDAARMIDQARFEGVADPGIFLLTGELGLANKRFDVALKDFQAAMGDPALAGDALQGQGLALIAMNRGDEAKPVLERAVF